MDHKPACIFCGSTATKESFYPKVLFNNKVFVYRECMDCKLNFNTPLLTGEDYTALYPVEYHDEFYFKTGKKFDQQLRILEKYKGIKSFVDYGCGDAGLLDFLSGHGYDCVGVEFNASLVGRLKQRRPGIRFYTVDEFSGLQEKYDCIHMGDVLEHMTDPNGIIQSLSKKLDTGGRFFIEGPIEHNSSLAYWFRKTVFRARKRLMPGRQVPGKPYHTFLANRKNQRDMLERNNLVTDYFAIYETAWPFPERLKDCRAPRAYLEYAIGRLSVFLSSILPSFGNRFYYIGQKKPLAKQGGPSN
jgi:SAM-dependent methyltransferase